MRIVVSLFFGSFFWVSSQVELAFEKANSLYNEGSYAAAAQSYESILNNGLHSAEIYYNLANSYYKQNRVGPSIYYYEKALLLKPEDKSTLNNLSFAQKMAVDKIEPIPEAGFLSFINTAATLFVLDTWAGICVCLMLIFIGLFTAYYLSYSTRKKRLFFVLGSLSLLGFIVALSLTFHKEHLSNTENYAVVFSQEIDVKLEPNLKSEAAFKLHEGAKIRLIEAFQGTWTKIRLSDGKTGWISNDAFKAL